MGMTKKDKEMQKLKEYCEQKKTLMDYLKGDHPIPTTRREFMASGLLTFSAAVAAPTLTQLISSSAWAQEVDCATGDGSAGSGADRALFIHVQLAGGAALYAQHVAAGAGGTPLPQPGLMGIGPNPNIVNRFSNQAPFFAGSNFLQSMDDQLDGMQDAYDNSTFVAVAAASVDDTSSNAQDVSGMLQAAGIVGEKLPTTIVGNNSSRFQGAVLDRTSMLRVQNAGSMEGALGVAGALGRLPGSADEQNALHVSMVKLIEDLNKNQVQALAADPGSHASQAAFKNLVQCAAQKNVSNMASQTNVDFLDGNAAGFADAAAYAAAFQGGGNNVTAAGQAIGAGLSGLTNLVEINLGGYDYHQGNSRATANQRDGQAGDLIGRILRGARAAGKPIFIMISSDGSVRGPRDPGAAANQNWAGDAGRRGMAYMISYNPTGAIAAAGHQFGNYSDASFQLNHFQGTEVAQVNPIGDLQGSPLMASAVFLNYLNVIGQPNLIDKVGQVKSMLTSSLPGGAGSIAQFYTRMKA